MTAILPNLHVNVNAKDKLMQSVVKCVQFSRIEHVFVFIVLSYGEV